ncbi:IS110 family transposase [Pacificispira sp.]|uniref:IS110 family transposase n=1 Tax=Pacificispira sp. TaxID=2888761 RepID=UPI003B522886
MQQGITIGLDIAKHVFQVHGVDDAGTVVVRRKLRRTEVATFFAGLPTCLVGMEACANSHHWARTLMELGHEVRLMPPFYVKPYVKRQKNDAADAEAICEAVTRPSMRFVAVKSEEQQSVLMLHRSRELLIRQRTMLINALRAHLSEFVLIARQGWSGVEMLLAYVEDDEVDIVPATARSALLPLVDHLRDLQGRIKQLDAEILGWHQGNEESQRLATVPGIGPITASAIAATIPDPGVFGSGRQMAAWMGLVPRQNSSGGKERLGRITKKGDPYLRKLLVVGAHAVLRHAKTRRGALHEWAMRLLERRPFKLAAVALANKLARIVWAVMASGDRYSPRGLEARP